MHLIDNIVAGHGVELAITGMIIVFSGLLLISTFIYFLPASLAWFDRLVGHSPAQQSALATAEAPLSTPTEDEVMAAISLALHIELERCGGDMQKLTITRSAAPGSFWNVAGKMRSLSNRSPYA